MLKGTVALLIASALVSTGCSDNDDATTATAPTTLRSVGTFSPGLPSLGIHPSFLSPELIHNFACPAIQPYRLAPTLTVGAPGDVGVFVTGVRMRFIDSSGITPPQVTLPAPALTAQFGTALVHARGDRTFPLDFRFGCGTGRTGTLVVSVDTRTVDGRELSTELRASVR